MYANSVLGTGSRTPGNGVMVNAIAQQFGQGNINITNNSLDLAVSGAGFFIVSNQGSPAYTRAGNFSLDSLGYVVNATNNKLQGFAANAAGQVLAGALTDLRIQTSDIAPSQTSEVNLHINLDSREVVPTLAFDPSNASTYNWSTAATIYDSLGNSHILRSYFRLDASSGTGNDWHVYTDLDGSALSATPVFNDLGLVSFDNGGALVSPVPAALADTWTPSGGAGSLAFNIDLTSSTQYGSDSTVNSLDQDGYAPGRLSGINISDGGILFARYTNGQALTLGQVALATFANPQGLVALGDTSWAESFDSGQPVVGAPQSGSRGSLQSGALEESNVDLSRQLVNLILAQRNYQANAKTIETANATTQTLINMR